MLGDRHGGYASDSTARLHPHLFLASSHLVTAYTYVVVLFILVSYHVVDLVLFVVWKKKKEEEDFSPTSLCAQVSIVSVCALLVTSPLSPLVCLHGIRANTWLREA